MASKIINGATIHYEDMGSGTPIMLTPGGRMAGEGLRVLADQLATNYRVILWDRRNCGASDVIIGGEPSEQEIWADDQAELLRQLDASPAYVGGGSAGARVSLITAIRHPEAVKGMLIWSVSGGEYAAQNLGNNYYDQYVEIAEKDGMASVVQAPFWAERIAQNPSNRDRLLNMAVSEFVSVMKRWRLDFNADHPVIGATIAQLKAIDTPTSLIYVDDLTHTGMANNVVAQNIPNAEQHPGLWTMEDSNRWSAEDPELSRRNQGNLMAPVFLDFLARMEAKQGAPA